MTFINPANLPETGHPMIDQGHARLAELANDLYLAWQQGQGAALAPRAARFVAALAEHFSEEERIMEDVALPTAEEHRGRHVQLLAEFTALAEALAEASGACADVMVDLFRAAERLVWEHEMVDDQDFWAHFAGRSSVQGPLIDWESHLAVGDVDIDAQHRALVALVNDLHAGIVAGIGRESLIGRVTGLRRFTARHFAWEERLMAEVPGAHNEAHAIMHAALLADLDRVLGDLRNGRFDTVEDLLGSYVKHWLLEHIATMDRRLADAVAAAGVVAADEAAGRPGLLVATG